MSNVRLVLYVRAYDVVYVVLLQTCMSAVFALFIPGTTVRTYARTVSEERFRGISRSPVTLSSTVKPVRLGRTPSSKAQQPGRIEEE